LLHDWKKLWRDGSLVTMTVRPLTCIWPFPIVPAVPPFASLTSLKPLWVATWLKWLASWSIRPGRPM